MPDFLLEMVNKCAGPSRTEAVKLRAYVCTAGGSNVFFDECRAASVDEHHLTNRQKIIFIWVFFRLCSGIVGFECFFRTC